ncbi:MAG: hypothetical protein AB9856_14350 [Cellulosilyticaceae bacterium]
MKNIEYSSSKPLERLEEGDKAIIRVNKLVMSSKDRERFRSITDGKYIAICTKPYYLDCGEYQELSGYYNMWLGDKRGVTGIFANEVTQ